MLQQVGLEGERVAFYTLSSSDGPRFAQIASELTAAIRALGPNPLRRLPGKEREPGGSDPEP